MRILHLTPYYAPAYAFGGVARAVEGLATALAARGHDITILTTDAFDQGTRFQGELDERRGQVRVIRCRNASAWLRGRLNLSTPLGMRRRAKSLLTDMDLLHVHELRTLENLLVAPVASDLRLPIALSPHGTLDLSIGRSQLKAGWDRLLSPRLLARIDHVIALNESEKQQTKALWRSFGLDPQPQCSIIPNGVNLREFESLPGAAGFRARYGLGAAPIVLYMGRLQARKGVDVLLRAFLAADVGESRLVIAGPDEGMQRRLQNLAADDSRIVFTGFLDSAARLEALAAADLFALPAIGEGQSIAVLEALAAGLPVLLSPGCHMDEVADWGAGYVAAPTADAFAGGLRALLQDGALRAEMSANARRLAQERFSWSGIAAEVEGVYAGMAR